MVHNLHNLVTQLQRFHYLIVNDTDSALHQINKAIKKINIMTKYDVHNMLRGITTCGSTYDDSIAIKVDSALYYLEAFSSGIWNIKYVLSSADNNTSGQYALLNARGTAENLLIALDAMRKTPENVSNGVTHTLNRIWSYDGTNRYSFCQSRYTLMIVIVTRIIGLLSQALENRKEINQTSNYDSNDGNAWYIQLFDHNLQANNTIGDVIDCSNELKSILEGAYETISSFEKTLTINLANDFYFKYDDILDLIWNDLETINFNISYFEDLLTKYSRNETTKLDISSLITAANHSHLEETLSNILARMDTHASEPLQNMMRDSKINIRKWLHNSLSAMGKLLPYFDTCIEMRARSPKMWRYPILKLDSPDILKYSFDDSFKTWPRNKSLRILLEKSEDYTLFTDILRSYGNNLSIAIHDLQTRLMSSKKETLTALGNLIADMQFVRQQSIIDKNFIL